MEASITFKAVGKTIGKKILLADLSFGVEKGSTFVLIGENGAGKSIILKLLVGLIEKDTGSVYIHGQDISSRSLETRSMCGYMPQNINLDDDLTIFDNISIYGQLHGLTSAEARKNTLHWAELLGFTQFLKQSPYDQAFGLQRKILFARALVHNPDVLLLDEPYRAMDALTKSIMHESLLEVYDRTRVTIFFITHDLEEAIFLGDRVIVMTTRPARTKKIVEVKINRPRDYRLLSSEEFRILVQETKEAVHEEAVKAFEAGERELA